MADTRQEDVAKAMEVHLGHLDEGTRSIGAVLHDMGADLINLWPPDRALEGKNVHVVCTAEDLDFIASGFMEALRSKKARPSYSCFWNEYRVKDVDGVIPDSSYMIAQYTQKGILKPDELVLVASSLTEYATAASNLARVMDRHDSLSQPLVFVPAAKSPDFDCFSESFKARGFEQPPFVLSGIPISGRGMRRGVDVHGILRRWTIGEYGGYDHAFIPETIGSQIPALKKGI
ncbi:hypothetical protein KX729_29455 [Rhizobium sp. XQZ8]|uniref:hypothetical protein n=1 Tax=Rhizobium populisoli TaxID=2859785 RepID=UPI001CA4EF34|nr:hypothetical protein [Rhizobium populisoli]MBW6425543.1 hypothetical protein [Rhizobium populisoli]